MRKIDFFDEFLFPQSETLLNVFKTGYCNSKELEITAYIADFEIRETLSFDTYVCPYVLRSQTQLPHMLTSSTLFVNFPDRSQTSLSIYKRSHARIDKQNNLTTIKMDIFTLLKPL